VAKCRICGNDADNYFYELKELMYGTGEKFKYFQCSKCNCLQIETLPGDMAKYYPQDYYSFTETPQIKTSEIEQFLQYHRYRQCLFGNNLLGSTMRPFLKKSPELETMKKAGIKEHMSVLDVGCGAGLILYLMGLAGMKNLTGIDPYIKDDIHYSEHLRVLKKDIHEIDGKWDFIFVNHVLEHVADQFQFFHEIHNKLDKNGICLMRIPTSSGQCWDAYRENWIQLDPPRHFYLHSIESIEKLVTASNLNIKEIIFDSTEFQFVGSEQAMMGIALEDSRSYIKNKATNLFSSAQINDFKKRAIALNSQKKGDQIAVVITHVK
jgi:SAM-dependent methyltransferase